MADAPVIYGAVVEGGLLFRCFKSGTGGPNNSPQQLGVISALPANGKAWELQLWINCGTNSSYSGAHYVGARAKTGLAMVTQTIYNFTTSATNLPTTTVVLDSDNSTITISLAAAATSNGNVSYQIRYEYRTLSASEITDQPSMT